MRNYILVFFVAVMTACQNPPTQMQTYTGEALGTYYSVKFFADKELSLEAELDSLFKVVNASMSNYQDDSDISLLNSGDTSVVVDQMFKEVFLLSKKIFDQTDGYFDPTVGNLVNAYGFGAQKTEIELDSTAIDSLMHYVGLEKVELTEDNKIRREYPEIYLDFNGIAKGYAVDRLGVLLEDKGVDHYLVEIGGEMRAKGENRSSGKTWRLGIDNPEMEKDGEELMGVMELKNKSLATSGNYRKFRYDSLSGEKFVHIIDPKTGYTKKTNLLSVSVIADDCATADAFATGFMAMDIEKAKNIAKDLKGVDVYFIYDQKGETETFLTKGFEKVMKK